MPRRLEDDGDLGARHRACKPSQGFPLAQNILPEVAALGARLLEWVEELVAHLVCRNDIKMRSRRHLGSSSSRARMPSSWSARRCATLKAASGS
jgi:hypothetical protein